MRNIELRKTMMKSSYNSILVLLAVTVCIASRTCQAWTMMPSRSGGLRAVGSSATSLKSSRDTTTRTNNSMNDEEDESSSSSLERVVVSGVSVSPKGFHVLLQTTKGILPLPITRDVSDSYRATSPESLTILQLLSHVDMAGAILPPESLAKMAIYQCETRSRSNDSNDKLLVQYIKDALPQDCPSETFKDAHPWFQSRIPLPQITLDQVTLTYDAETKECQCQLTCALPRDVMKLGNADSSSSSSSLMVSVTSELVEPFSFHYHPETSPLFLTLALALRYKAPIVLKSASSLGDETYYPLSRLDRDFPQRTSLKKLQDQSSRISQNIERGFEINKLTGALQIAKRLGDTQAMERIQAKLDEFGADNMDQLPVVASSSSTTTNSTTNSTTPVGEQEPVASDGMADDLDRNILQ